jgi:hypothetical protein
MERPTKREGAPDAERTPEAAARMAHVLELARWVRAP